MAFNRVILVGNIVADPELKTTPNGVSVTRFSIAVNRRARSGEQPITDFFNIVAWRQTAEFISRFFTKGKPILISGQLQNSNWTDNNGVKHYSAEIVADEVTFVDRSNQSSTPNVQTPLTGSAYEDLDANDDELPFN